MITQTASHAHQHLVVVLDAVGLDDEVAVPVHDDLATHVHAAAVREVHNGVVLQHDAVRLGDRRVVQLLEHGVGEPGLAEGVDRAGMRGELAAEGVRAEAGHRAAGTVARKLHEHAAVAEARQVLVEGLEDVRLQGVPRFVEAVVDHRLALGHGGHFLEDGAAEVEVGGVVAAGGGAAEDDGEVGNVLWIRVLSCGGKGRSTIGSEETCFRSSTKRRRSCRCCVDSISIFIHNIIFVSRRRFEKWFCIFVLLVRSFRVTSIIASNDLKFLIIVIVISFIFIFIISIIINKTTFCWR